MPGLQTRQSLNSRSVGACCAKSLLFGLGAVIATVGLLLCVLWPFLVSRLIASQLALSPNTRSYNMWVETPIPIYFHIYMFNWTNPSTSLRGPDKPAFTQMGPYVFREHHSKKNVQWNDNNNTITYLNQKQWHFVPEMSNGTLNDTVTNLNAVAMTVGWHCLSLGPWVREFLNTFITMEESLVKTDTVGNLLFNGSDDHLLAIAHLLKPYIKSLPDMDKFGWFYKRNMSLYGDGVFTMGSGHGDINQLGLLSAWDYKPRTVFPGECGRVYGSYGEEFPPNYVDQDKITIFANDLCSGINLSRTEEASQFGIPSVKFAGGEDVFSNKTTCYCRTNTTCPASGVRDLSLCNSSPAMVSWPHFYLADPSYREAVVGMKPDKDKHEFYMNLAEVTSVTLDVRGRMQLNMLMQTIPGMNLYKGIKRTVMPMLWFEQVATLTPELSSQISVLVQLVQWGRWVLLALGVTGIVLISIGALLQARGCFGRPDEQLLH